MSIYFVIMITVSTIFASYHTLLKKVVTTAVFDSISTLHFDLSVTGCITSLHNAIPETFRMVRSRLYPDVGWDYIDFCVGNST